MIRPKVGIHSVTAKGRRLPELRDRLSSRADPVDHCAQFRLERLVAIDDLKYIDAISEPRVPGVKNLAGGCTVSFVPLELYDKRATQQPVPGPWRRSPGPTIHSG